MFVTDIGDFFINSMKIIIDTTHNHDIIVEERINLCESSYTIESDSAKITIGSEIDVRELVKSLTFLINRFDE